MGGEISFAMIRLWPGPSNEITLIKAFCLSSGCLNHGILGNWISTTFYVASHSSDVQTAYVWLKDPYFVGCSLGGLIHMGCPAKVA